MKGLLRIVFRLARRALLLIGLLALLFATAQFTPLPWRAYKRLATIADPAQGSPTHILVMGGSGIPGESGLMRTFYGARAAALHPAAEVLVAMPMDSSESAASRAYLDELVHRGVSPKRFRILADGNNTREQALRLAEHLADQTNMATVLVVTSPEHIRRTAACLRHVGIPHLAAFPAHPLSIEDSIPWTDVNLDAPAPAPGVQDDGAGATASFALLRYNLWANLGYTVDALREYTALLYYRLRGWI